MSLGSRGDWSYEADAFASSKCDIHTFDCTGQFVVPETLRSRTTFHHICIGPFNPSLGVGKKHFRSWSEVVSSLGNRPVAHLKMDIEGNEFAVAAELAKSRSHVEQPAQISLELHLPRRMTFLERITYAAHAKGQFMQKFRSIGYAFVDRNDNIERGCCTEILLVQKSQCCA